MFSLVSGQTISSLPVVFHIIILFFLPSCEDNMLYVFLGVQVALITQYLQIYLRVYIALSCLLRFVRIRIMEMDTAFFFSVLVWGGTSF